MDRSRFLLLACVVVAACRGGPSRLTGDEASLLLAAHAEALASGDTLRIKPFWSQRSSTRDGFWYMHSWRGARLRLSDWPQFLEEFALQVTEIQHSDHYTTIDIEWTLKSGSPGGEPVAPRPMRYHAVREQGRWVLANPIDVLTEGWSSQETDCFRFHYPEEMAKDGYVDDMTRMDRECARVADAIGLKLRTRIDFYVARTTAECGQLLDQPPAHGYAATSSRVGLDEPIGFRLAVSTSFFHPHEVVHVLQALARIPDVDPVLTEGFAVAFGGGPVFSSQMAMAETHHLIGRREYIPLPQLLTMSDAEFFRQNFITYLEAGALVTFLIDRFGIDSFRRLAEGADSPGGLPAAIHQVYGVTLERLETEWKEYLARLALPEVGYSISDQAVEVFSMPDPLGDDVGDGDYSYPNERFAPGVFDLTGFRVLKDSERAYFVLTFREMQQPVTYGSSTERFLPGVVVAIHKGPFGERRPQQHAHGVRLPVGSGYDVKLSVGARVSASDNHGRLDFTSGPVWDEMADMRARTITFSLPIAFLGEPADEWKYFVGVGLATDRTMNFLYGGPAPVYQDHPVFISGGNNPDGQNPAFIDILFPPTVDQVAVLSAYDDHTAATVSMVGGR
jgi:hypothetical protein